MQLKLRVTEEDAALIRKRGEAFPGGASEYVLLLVRKDNA